MDSVSKADVAEHRTTALCHTVEFSLLYVVTGSDRSQGKQLTHEDYTLSTHACD
jgi:hypothetical protein